MAEERTTRAMIRAAAGMGRPFGGFRGACKEMETRAVLRGIVP